MRQVLFVEQGLVFPLAKANEAAGNRQRAWETGREFGRVSWRKLPLPWMRLGAA